MRYGEIIELGWHKLMCGDATCRDRYNKLTEGKLPLEEVNDK